VSWTVIDGLPPTLLVDAVLGWMVVEGAWLAWRHRRHGNALAPREFLPALAAGGFLLLGLRGALAGAAWPWLAACLCAGGLAHGLDLWQRRRPR